MNPFVHANVAATVGHIANGDRERARANLAQLDRDELRELRAALLAEEVPRDCATRR